MGNVKNAEFWESKRYNQQRFLHYYNMLIELAVSMFEWKNLPDTCDATYLELALLSDGDAVFFKDEEVGYASLKCMASGKFNLYRIPEIREAYSENGYHANLTADNSVIIYNSQLRRPWLSDLEMFAKDLYDIDTTCGINIKAQKTPVLVACDENTRLSLTNVYAQYEGNRPVIFGNKALRPDALKVLSTDAPFVAKDLQELKVQKWNEALTFLGISSINFQKKERLITDEVTRNQGGTIANRYTRLNERRKACDKINALFGLDVWCDFREDYQEVTHAEDTVEGEPNSDGEGGEVRDE